MSRWLREFTLRVDGAGLAVALLLSGAAWGWGLRPLLAAQEARASRAQTAHALHEQLESRRAEAERAAAALQRARKLAEERGVALEGPERLNHRIAALASLAERAGLRIDGVKPEAARRSGAYGVTRIDIEARGDAPALGEFLRLAHGEFPDILVERCTIETEAVTTRYTARAALTLIWFTRPPAMAEVKE